MTIYLEKLRFYGYHGLYAQEQKLGAWFELDVTLEWPTGDALITHLHETVNYVEVYGVIKQRMAQPTELLETVAMELVHSLKEHFPVLASLRIRVSKINPPLVNFLGSVAVDYSKSF